MSPPFMEISNSGTLKIRATRKQTVRREALTQELKRCPQCVVVEVRWYERIGGLECCEEKDGETRRIYTSI